MTHTLLTLMEGKLPGSKAPGPSREAAVKRGIK